MAVCLGERRRSGRTCQKAASGNLGLARLCGPRQCGAVPFIEVLTRYQFDNGRLAAGEAGSVARARHPPQPARS